MNPERQENQPDIMKTSPGVTVENAEQTKKGTNPVIAIAIAVLVALILAGISLIIFLRSDTRERVHITEQETISTLGDSDLSESPDESSSLSEADLNSIEINISKTAAGVSSDEFDASEMTDASLGL